VDPIRNMMDGGHLRLARDGRWLDKPEMRRQSNETKSDCFN
jgi:hypothetical protein